MRRSYGINSASGKTILENLNGYKESYMPPVCSSCGTELPSTEQGHCPACGSKEQTLCVNVEDRIKVKESGVVEHRREFYEENRALKFTVIGIAVGAPLLGLLVTGLPGLVAGFILGGLSYFLGPYAVTKIREINRSTF